VHAGGKDTRAVYAVVGQDRLLRNDAVGTILAQLENEIDELGPTRLDGSEANLAEVLDEVRTFSLLGSRRMVIVDDADPFITEHRQALERYCADPWEGNSLLLLCGSLPRNTRLYKIIAGHGQVIPCDPPKPKALVAWVRDRSRNKHGKRLSADAAQRLREQVGDTLGLLDAELAKLATFVGDRPDITSTDIEALTGHHREEKVFAIIDAVSSGDTSAALEQWEQVLATDRAAPARAIGGLAWAVRGLLEARPKWVQGADLYELSRRLYVDTDVLQRRLERLSVPRLEQFQRDLLAADLECKTGVSKVELAVEKLIVKNSTGAAAPG